MSPVPGHAKRRKRWQSTPRWFPSDPSEGSFSPRSRGRVSASPVPTSRWARGICIAFPKEALLQGGFTIRTSRAALRRGCQFLVRCSRGQRHEAPDGARAGTGLEGRGPFFPACREKPLRLVSKRARLAEASPPS